MHTHTYIFKMISKSSCVAELNRLNEAFKWAIVKNNSIKHIAFVDLLSSLKITIKIVINFFSN